LPTLLHLSDIHLAHVRSEDVLGDYKDEFVPLAERLGRVQMLEETLERLATELEEPLDALIVSGDITVSGRRDGYARLESLLGKLGAARPPAERTLFVPGNHDVTWYTPPSSSSRYELFEEFISSRGYVRPIIDGVDLDASGVWRPGREHCPLIIGPGASYMLAAINTSNYSGSREPLRKIDGVDWGAIEASLPDEGQEELRRVLTRDAARVSPSQLTNLRRKLEQADIAIAAGGSDPRRTVRIAVLHHQLLPVSATEELKSTEAIVNLGLLRAFLRDNHFSVVLHGHKHVGSLYWDHVARDPSTLDSDPHRVLVVSGATINSPSAEQHEVARLIELEGTQSAPHCNVISLSGVIAGGDLRRGTPTRARLWRQPTSPPSVRRLGLDVIRGDDLDDTYDRLMSEFDLHPPLREVNHVVCEIADISTASLPPERYPELPNVPRDDRHRWFEDLVTWWQAPRSILSNGLRFTHGGRIQEYGLTKVPQLEHAVEALGQKESSSRAVLVLVDPLEDDLRKADQKFPAFCLAQLLIRSTPHGRRLDCVAYFRKQEMRYWWPVNVAELASLQTKACSELRGSHYPDLETGFLRTVSSMAFAGTTVPRVAVPKIDRAADEDPGKLTLLAVAAVTPTLGGREDLFATWNKFVDDLEPLDERDPDGVPVAEAGLRKVIEALSQVSEDGESNELQQALDALLQRNIAYMGERQTDHRHSAWVAGVRSDLQRIRAALTAVEEG
jgi:hypothetical protein